MVAVAAVAVAIAIAVTVILLNVVDRSETRRWLVPLVVAGWVVVLVGAATLWLMWTDQATVTSAQDLANVRFGEPLVWWEQDQTMLDPPSFPREQSPLTPLEHPSDVLWGRLLVNLAVIGTPVALAASAALRMTRDSS